MLECTCLALLLSLLRYLLLEACAPPALWLLSSVNAVLKVSMSWAHIYVVYCPNWFAFCLMAFLYSVTHIKSRQSMRWV